MPRRLVALVAVLAAHCSPAADPGLRFEVRLAAGNVPDPPAAGRVLVAVGPARGVPSFTRTQPPVLPVLGADVEKFTADTTVTLDGNSATFPLTPLNELPAGEYTARAVFAFNRDVNLPDAPGNRYCDRVRVKLDPKAGTTVKLTLDKTYEEEVPEETATHKYLKLPSKLLSDFHGRPMVCRVGVVLPPEFETQKNKKYALIVHIGGFGTRYTHAERIAPDPRFVQILLDGAGPFGDPYQVNSANNGPYGDALTKEVIPYIEKTYRCLGTPKARFTCGGSTGGWVSLALQVFYPDFFNGCWSQCPDGVDFRAYELINVYTDANAYANRWGFDRPSKRTIDGDTVFTVRHECQLENVLGRGGRWELSGRDWASWNATYGPRGADGLPVPLWDGKTGAIDKSVLPHWEKYDLRLVLERNWKTLGPKLAGGKVHIWVGDADDYFLNNAVHRLKASLVKQIDPKFDGTILIEPRKPHSSGGWTQKQMLDEMADRVRRE
ncbi:MAG TPA: alpha/beta hydrolase-fold protein [Fimbriiglobus sp.]|nr:alpha/beta hydrolase-fold protein [Fimbriiglobus sp.]